jgi:hypothetical protein
MFSNSDPAVLRLGGIEICSMRKRLVVLLLVFGLGAGLAFHCMEASAKKVNKVVVVKGKPLKGKTVKIHKVKKIKSRKLIKDSIQTNVDFGSLLFSNFIRMNTQEMDDLFSATDSASVFESGGSLPETLDAAP